jgi:hypothetical protein
MFQNRNKFFLLKHSYPTNNRDKRKGTNREKHDSSLRVPLTDEILNLWNNFLEIVDYLQSTPQICKIIESF